MLFVIIAFLVGGQARLDDIQPKLFYDSIYAAWKKKIFE